MLGNTISPSFPHHPWLCIQPGANFKVNGKFRKLREISYCDILSDYLWIDNEIVLDASLILCLIKWDLSISINYKKVFMLRINHMNFSFFLYLFFVLFFFVCLFVCFVFLGNSLFYFWKIVMQTSVLVTKERSIKSKPFPIGTWPKINVFCTFKIGPFVPIKKGRLVSYIIYTLFWLL